MKASCNKSYVNQICIPSWYMYDIFVAVVLKRCDNINIYMYNWKYFVWFVTVESHTAGVRYDTMYDTTLNDLARCWMTWIVTRPHRRQIVCDKWFAWEASGTAVITICVRCGASSWLVTARDVIGITPLLGLSGDDSVWIRVTASQMIQEIIVNREYQLQNV